MKRARNKQLGTFSPCRGQTTKKNDLFIFREGSVKRPAAWSLLCRIKEEKRDLSEGGLFSDPCHKIAFRRVRPG
ncbi:hypothetical protein MHYP_G00113630 [Metynnis hypsauchen]